MSTRTGPQIYPGADTSAWRPDSLAGNPMESNVVVWHSTEGTSLPDYGGGASAPTFTAVPDFRAKKIKWYQHFGVDESARALRNLSGGVQTNTLNVVQVEITGTCDPSTHAKWAKAGRNHLYTPELPDWVIRDLAEFTRWLSDKHGIPMTTGVKFVAYPPQNNNDRMSFDQWNNYKGHCGHQHVPENDHGDPGAFPMQAILDLAKGGAAPGPVDPAPSKPVVSLAHVVKAAQTDPGAAQGAAVYRDEVKVVEQALAKLGYLDAQWVDGSYGTKTLYAYSAFQKYLGYTGSVDAVGSGADGRPGPHSLTWLANKTQLFTVTP